MLSVMAGPDEWDRTSLEGAPQDYVGALALGVRGLRVAFSPDLGGLAVDAEVATVVREAAHVFDGLGCVVEEVKPGFADSHDLIRCMWSAHEAGIYAQYLPRWRDRMDPGLVACIEDGLRYSMVEYVEARGRKFAFWDSVRPIFEKYDLLLTPTISVAAFPVGRLNPEHWPQHPWTGSAGPRSATRSTSRDSRPRRFPPGSPRLACRSACRSSAAASPTSPCCRRRRPSKPRARGESADPRSIN